MAKRMCEKCGEPLEEAPDIHYATLCMLTELGKGRDEIKALKQSVKDWKDAWTHTRSIIGWLWWRHPSIASDAERAYYQKAQTNEEAV